MSQQIASLFAKVGADTSAFERAMHGVDSRLGAVGGAFGKLGDAIHLGVTVAAGAAAAGVAGLTAVVVKSTQSAADMEQRVADIGAAMSLTAGETDKVSKLISDLGLDPNLKVSATEAADVIEKLGTAGLSLDTILGGAARSTVMLANATGADFGQAASIASDSMAIFNLRAEDLDKSISNILATTQASKFEIGDYAEALAQGGGVASAAGVSFTDFNTTIAAISPLFAGGSDAGTSFKTFLQRLIPQSKEAASTMKALGLMTEKGGNEFFDANGKMKSMSKVAGLLKKALTGLSDEQKNSALSTIFGADAMRAAVAIAQQGEEGFSSLAETMARTDVGQAMATRMDTATGAWEIFLGVVESVQIMVGDKFLPVWKDMVRWMTDFVSSNAGTINGFFEGLAARLTAIWVVFRENGLTAALGELGNQLNWFYQTFVAWLSNSGLLGQIQSTLAGWSSAFANWAIDLWGKFVWPRLVEFWNGLTSWITDPAKRQVLIDTLMSWGQQFGAWARSLWEVQIKPRLLEFWNGLTSWVTDPAKRQMLIDKLGEWGKAAWQWVVDAAPVLIEKATKLWNGLVKWVGDNLPTWQAKLVEWGGAAWKWIVDAVPQVQAKLAELWTNTIKPWLDEKTGGLGTAFEEWTKKATGWLGDVQKSWQDSFPTIQTRFGEFVDNMEEKLGRLQKAWADLWGDGDKPGSMAGGVDGFVKSFPVQAFDLIATVIEGFTGNMVAAVETFAYVRQAFDAMGKGDWGKVGEMLGKATDALMRSNIQMTVWRQQMDAIRGSMPAEKRAMGGPVQAGQPYVVGDGGRPEMFVPGSDGYIFPDASRWGGGERTLRVIVESPLPTNRQAIRELALALKREIDLTGAVMVG